MRRPGAAQPLFQAAPGGDCAGAHEDVLTRRLSSGAGTRLGPSFPGPGSQATQVDRRLQAQPVSRRATETPADHRTLSLACHSQKHVVLVS